MMLVLYEVRKITKSQILPTYFDFMLEKSFLILLIIIQNSLKVRGCSTIFVKQPLLSVQRIYQAINRIIQHLRLRARI